MSMLTNAQIAAIRKDYTLKSFDEQDVLPDPLEQFKLWFNEALESEVPEPNAMTLATVGTSGKPSARIVLLKGFSKGGFVFYTNYNSNKGVQIAANPNAALVFFWPELQRQVRIEGEIEKGSAADADAYFASRPLESRIGAHASNQSHVLQSRAELEQAYASCKTLFEEQPVLRPQNWGGYILIPQQVEFWQGRASRLHDRFLFTREQHAWKRERLAP